MIEDKKGNGKGEEGLPSEIREGDRVRVTYTGIVSAVREDPDGTAYEVSSDTGYGYHYAKEAAGDTIELIEREAGSERSEARHSRR
jgi:hypothetical protein